MLSISTAVMAAIDGKSEGDQKPYAAIEEAISNLEALDLFWDAFTLPEDTTSIGPDLVYEYRIAELNRQSIIPLIYHPLVRKYIRIYTVERRDQVAQMLGLARLYFPLFEERLDMYRLPLELVYLSVVESALNPLAVSKSGAVGLWQFKLNTGKMFDLHVDSFVDDRMDPARSTDAACVYLQYLYRLFDDWALALAAYNAGPGAVQRAIDRSGGERDFWKLLPALPEAAQNYVPAFIAAYYVFAFSAEHGIQVESPKVDFQQVDTVLVRDAVSFEAVARWTGVSLEMLHFLNPRYRHGYVPKPGSEGASMTLPKSAMREFIANQSRIHAQSYKVVETPYPKGNGDKKIKLEYRVKKGEYLHKIAIRYGCTVADLKRWNGDRTVLNPGDLLEIWVPLEFYQQLRDIGDSGRSQ